MSTLRKLLVFPEDEEQRQSMKDRAAPQNKSVDGIRSKKQLAHTIEINVEIEENHNQHCKVQKFRQAERALYRPHPQQR